MRLGSYDIVAPIGSGGMGEVYRATDANLGRQVAIKVLPEAVAHDAERLARFDREARTLAALNHPNIAQVYAIERLRPPRAEDMQIRGEGSASVRAGDGTQAPLERPRPPRAEDMQIRGEGSASVRAGGGAPAPLNDADAIGPLALVMELVDGEDLSAIIARGPLSPSDALPIARQIADALEAAHEQGIVHRDLKPANVKVRADGTVKVLDFGLAKAVEPVASMSPGVSQPTITTPPFGYGSGRPEQSRGAAMTQMGMILGTAAYMAPEQARGRPVDKRADIWAFGCVLFEMLTGRRAFEGDDVSMTLARVLEREPALDLVPATAPASVRAVLRRCLQKDPRQRARDMGDVGLALEGGFETAAPGDIPSTDAPCRRLWMIVSAVAAALAMALAVPALRYLREVPPPETRTDIVTPATDDPADFALSPDGRQIVFVARGDGPSRLWVRSLSTTTAEPLVGTEDARFPFWSPDGRSLAFFAGGSLKRLDLGGGAPRPLTPARDGFGGAWGPDGVILFSAGPAGPLKRVSAAGGDATDATTLGPGQGAHRWPQILPADRQLLFHAVGPAAGIYLVSLDGGTPVRLTAGAVGAGVYQPSGWLLWVRDGTLVAQRLDPATAALSGEPVTIADGVPVSALGRSAISAASSGSIAIAPAGSPGDSSPGSTVPGRSWARSANLASPSAVPVCHPTVGGWPPLPTACGCSTAPAGAPSHPAAVCRINPV